MENTKNKKRKKLIIIGSIGLVVIAIGLFFWVKSMRYISTENAQIDGDIHSIRSSVTAHIHKIYFKDNQYVHKGDTLLVFDTVQLNAKVKQAEAALEKAKNNLSVSDIQALASKKQSKSSQQDILSLSEDVAKAKAKLDKAQKDIDRDAKLRKVEAITPAQFETDSTRLAEAKAIYQQAIYRKQSSESLSSSLLSQAKAAHVQISTALALVVQREAELTVAKDQLDHAIILAPTNGIVSKRGVNTGQYVSSGQSLFAVIDEQHLWVTANIKETKLKDIRPGQKVKIKVDAYPDLKITGTVESFEGATGAKTSLLPPNNATGNYIKVTQRLPIRINISSFFSSKNKPNSRNETILYPGLSVIAKIKIK